MAIYSFRCDYRYSLSYILDIVVAITMRYACNTINSLKIDTLRNKKRN